MTEGSVFFGRREIFTDCAEITASNVVEVLTKALKVHKENQSEIDYLYNYYKGNQPVLHRTKQIRPEICNKIVENRANEIVSFKVGYLMGEPVQYVNRGESEDASDGIKSLNEYVFSEDKAAKDKELADWFTICGVGNRMVLPDKQCGDDPDESPFEIFTLDPRYSFVVKYSGLGNKVVMGVKFVKTDDENVLYSVYTASYYYEILDDEIVKQEANGLGEVPIIEYVANSSRQGAFEIVLPLLDAINEVASNRLDGVEQFIQALMMFKGVDVEAGDFTAIREQGGIKVPLDGDVKYLVQELNQSETQTLKDDMYQTVLTIVGMPNRNGGTSTSDTGSAVIMRDGWSAAEARAKDTELMFKKSEKQFLRLAIKIANTIRHLNLKLSDIEIRFTRRNYENIQEKAQVLNMMLSNSKIHPQLAFAYCGMFADPELAYSISEQYAAEQEAKLAQELADDADDTDDTDNTENPDTDEGGKDV